MGVDRALAKVSIGPDPADQTVSGLHMSGPFQKIPKKAKLNRCKRDFLSMNAKAVAFHIDVEGANLERRRRRWFAMVGTPQDRPYPEGEFPGQNRRSDKIIGAELEGEHPIDLIAVSAEADHRQA